MIAFCTLYLRYRHLPRSLEPSRFTTAAVWISGFIMLFMVGYSVVRR